MIHLPGKLVNPSVDETNDGEHIGLFILRPLFVIPAQAGIHVDGQRLQCRTQSKIRT
jgi:hypothetical protein